MPKEYVVDGAELECSMGSSSSNLVVLPVHRVKLTGKFKANIGDCKPIINVPPFGKCKSLANPAVAAATAANRGKLTPVPCTPTCSEWIPSKTDYLLDGMNPLMDTDNAVCPLGAGMIKITDSGQGDSKDGLERVIVDNAEIAEPERPPEIIPKPPQEFGQPPPGETVKGTKGGSYKDIRDNMAERNESGEDFEVHHMPPASINGLDYNDGPAIKMKKQDHRKTASCGSSKDAKRYRGIQQSLVEQGKFRKAVQMDIDDIRRQFGNKYNDALAEYKAYISKHRLGGK